MKYAKLIDNTVDTISYVPQEGFVEVADTVFAGMVKDSAGNFDDSDETKALRIARNQEIQDRITNRASGKQKLKDLGLDDNEIEALVGK